MRGTAASWLPGPRAARSKIRPNPLRAIHRAGHSRGRERAPSAHLAVEQERFHETLDRGEAPLESLRTQRHDDRPTRHHHALESPIDGFEKPGMTYGPPASPEHATSSAWCG